MNTSEALLAEHSMSVKTFSGWYWKNVCCVSLASCGYSNYEAFHMERSSIEMHLQPKRAESYRQWYWEIHVQ